ncbi:MAG TPA: M56 family metallopeptidase [Gemmatimonadaceae bacterium]|nr:M56 family metallopeptidase [Gemmatimonadaceae bacterium]
MTAPTPLAAAGAVLVTYGVHSGLACALAWAACRRLERPQDRELLWKAALVAPILSSAMAILRGSMRGDLVDLGRVLRGVMPLPLPGRQMMVHVLNDGHGSSVVRQVSDPVGNGGMAIAAAVALICVLGAIVRFARARHSLERALRSRQSTGGLETQDGRRVRFSVAAGIQSPVALGSAEICLPTAVMREFDAEHRRCLIAHEAAHLQRRDPLWLCATELIAALTAFQPLAPVVQRALRWDCELICDEAAVRDTRDRATLIAALALLAVPFDPRARFSGLASAYDGSPLAARAQRIARLTPETNRATRRHVAFAAAVALTLGLCALPAVVAAVPDQQPLPGRWKDPGAAALHARTLTLDTIVVSSGRQPRQP